MPSKVGQSSSCEGTLLQEGQRSRGSVRQRALLCVDTNLGEFRSRAGTCNTELTAPCALDLRQPIGIHRHGFVVDDPPSRPSLSGKKLLFVIQVSERHPAFMCQRRLYRMLPVEDSEASDEECIPSQQVKRSGVAIRRGQRVSISQSLLTRKSSPWIQMQAKPRTPFSNDSKFKELSGRIILLTGSGSEQGQKPVSPPGEASISAEQSRKALERRRNDIATKRYSLREGKGHVYKEVSEPPDDDYLYCENCQDFFVDSCPVHGPPVFIKDTAVDKGHPNRSALTVPPGLRIGPSGIPDAGLGVWNEASDLPVGVCFGPFEGQVTQDEEASRSGYAWVITKGSNCYEYVDGEDKSCSNWMRYVNCARHDEEQNLVAFQYRRRIFYRTCQVVRPGCELLVWYGDEYAQQLGIKGVVQAKPEMHPCSSCPRAFSSKKLLCQHVKRSHPSQIAPGMSARKRLQSVQPCSEDHNQQQQGADPQSWNDKDEGQEVEKGARSLLKRIRHRGRSGALLTTPTEPKGHSSEGGRILEERLNTLQKVHQEDSGILSVGRGVPSSVMIKYGGCGKGFNDGSQLKRHQHTHSGDRAYACREGGRSFAGMSDVITPQRTHSREETYVCKDCGMGYTEKSVLVRHKRTHSGKKPYVCPECGQHFTVKASLNTHKRTHPGVKPYVCMQCRHCFSSKSGLTLHHKTHTGEKPYACRDCGQGFSQKSYLMRHQKRHSGK